MALSHAMLAALSHKPLSGYDLTKTFKTTTGYFWHATRQQIYSELRRLESKALITGTRQQQEKYPDKIVWSITKKGTLELTEWLNSSSSPASMKEDLFVKLYALNYANPEKFLQQLIERKEYHRERLALFQSIESRLSKDDDELNTRNFGHLLGVRAGILYEKAVLKWCRETIPKVKARLDVKSHKS